MIRLAIYYTPPDHSPLSLEAARWLGRNNTSLDDSAYRPLETLSQDRYRELIDSPFHYGFHGTIKPPFRLASGVGIEQIVNKLRIFAANNRCFTLPPLVVSYMHDFFCLRPAGPCKALDQLAADAVILFDEYRRPADEEELARRRSAGLTPGQEKSLQEWGYPYLMDEFRFHLTLTGKLDNEEERQVLAKEIHKRFVPGMLQEVPFSSLALFMEKNKEPMRRIESFALSS